MKSKEIKQNMKLHILCNIKLTQNKSKLKRIYFISLNSRITKFVKLHRNLWENKTKSNNNHKHVDCTYRSCKHYIPH